jgi:hypothetical protein
MKRIKIRISEQVALDGIGLAILLFTLYRAFSHG